MPFAGYANFDVCVKEVMSKKKMKKAQAESYCGAIKHKVEG